MSFRREAVGITAMAALLAACSAALPESVSPDPADPQAPAAAVPYRTVMAGTRPHLPVGLKPWRELNEGVAPGAGRSP